MGKGLRGGIRVCKGKGFGWGKGEDYGWDKGRKWGKGLGWKKRKGFGGEKGEGYGWENEEEIRVEGLRMGKGGRVLEGKRGWD